MGRKTRKPAFRRKKKKEINTKKGFFRKGKSKLQIKKRK